MRDRAAAAAPPPARRWHPPRQTAACSRRPVPSCALSPLRSPRNSPGRYARHKAPNKRRGAAGVLGPAEGCAGADVTGPQPAGMTHAGEQSTLHGPRESTVRVGGHRAGRE